MQKEILHGRNVVHEILRAGRRKVFRIFWSRQSRDASTLELQKLIEEKKIPFIECSSDKIKQLTHSIDHQNVAAEVSAFEYAELGEVVLQAQQKKGFLLLLDEIQDPHNVGALIRTAHLCGAKAVILMKNRQALITPTVCKAAAGAQEYLPIVLETNLVNVIRYLKENDFLILGAEGNGESIYKKDLQFPLGLVMGSEGKGLRRLSREHCDALVSIPMEGVIGSFNVSVAGGILMSEIHRKCGLNS